MKYKKLHDLPYMKTGKTCCTLFTKNPSRSASQSSGRPVHLPGSPRSERRTRERAKLASLPVTSPTRDESEPAPGGRAGSTRARAGSVAGPRARGPGWRRAVERGAGGRPWAPWAGVGIAAAPSPPQQRPAPFAPRSNCAGPSRRRRGPAAGALGAGAARAAAVHCGRAGRGAAGAAIGAAGRRGRGDSGPAPPLRACAGAARCGRCRDGAAAAAAGAARVPRSAAAAARRRRVQPLPGQRLHLHAARRPQGVLLPAHAQGGLAGARVPGRAGREGAFPRGVSRGEPGSPVPP